MRIELFQSILKGIGLEGLERMAIKDSKLSKMFPEMPCWHIDYAEQMMPSVRKIEKLVTGVIYSKIESLQVEEPQTSFDGMSPAEIYKAGQQSMLMQTIKVFEYKP